MPSNIVNIAHFVELRGKINCKLNQIKEFSSLEEKEIIEDQIYKHTWLYGALGQVPSEVMFIAENPSITGINQASVDTVDGNNPDIEAQWWGGKNNNAATVFRPVLYETGLKISSPRVKGGWNCYITNVIKRANYAKFQEKKPVAYRIEQEKYWADILRWEIEEVQPKVLFCLGRNAENAVKRLIKEGCIPNIPFYYVRHYSDRGKLDDIRKTMKSQIENSLNKMSLLTHKNVYKPRLLSNIKVNGIVLEHASPGENVKVAEEMFITPEHPLFSEIASHLFEDLIKGIDINHVNQLLVIIKPDERAYVFKSFPLSMKVITRLSEVHKYQLLYKKDIVDISSASFDCEDIDVNPEENDKLIFLYRQSWNFGLYFNFTGKLDIPQAKQMIGYCIRRLLYLNEYKFNASTKYFNLMLTDGWFPFIGLFGGGIDKLRAYYQDNKKHPHILVEMINSFDKDRVERMANRWWNNQIFNSKKKLLREGIDNYNDSKYISACKVLATELDGILRIAFHKEFNKLPKTNDLIRYIRDIGTRHFYSIDSLTFPNLFFEYLEKFIFQKFDIEKNVIPEGRHSVAHGVAGTSIYTREFSLKLILTLDNIYFYFGNHFKIADS